jgi:hypothetical protein
MAPTRMKNDVALTYRTWMAIGTTLVIMLVTSACGAGQAAQTSQDIVTH